MSPPPPQILSGPDRTRTCDIRLAKAALSQLSYRPLHYPFRIRDNYPRFCHFPLERERVVIYLFGYCALFFCFLQKSSTAKGFSSRLGYYPISGASCDGSKHLAVACPTRLALHQPAPSPSHHHCWQCWCALTAPFQPSPVIEIYYPSAGLLAVAVLRRATLARTRPHLRFRGVAFLLWCRAESREVPLKAIAPSDDR